MKTFIALCALTSLACAKDMKWTVTVEKTCITNLPAVCTDVLTSKIEECVTEIKASESSCKTATFTTTNAALMVPKTCAAPPSGSRANTLPLAELEIPTELALLTKAESLVLAKSSTLGGKFATCKDTAASGTLAYRKEGADSGCAMADVDTTGSVEIPTPATQLGLKADVNLKGKSGLVIVGSEACTYDSEPAPSDTYVAVYEAEYVPTVPPETTTTEPTTSSTTEPTTSSTTEPTTSSTTEPTTSSTTAPAKSTTSPPVDESSTSPAEDSSSSDTAPDAAVQLFTTGLITAAVYALSFIA